MKAMILAAGGGTRLYPLTFTLPKPMAPVCNRPVMEHIITHVRKFGIDQIIVNLHSMPQQIESHFKEGSHLKVHIHYSHEQEPLGTAGGVKNVQDLLTETFMVIGGDDLHDIDLSEMLTFHRKSGAVATIGLSHEEDVHQYGVVVTDEAGRIQEFQEKPRPEEARSHWVNNGIYIFEPAILDMIPDGVFYDFGSQLFPVLKDGKAPFYGFKCSGYWKDIGNLQEYHKVHMDCLSGKVKMEFPGVEKRPGVWVEEGSTLDEQAYVQGPVIIGKRCRVGAGARIIGPSAIGKFNVIDGGAQVIRTVMWDYNHLKGGTRLTDCLAGSECILEEGSVYEKAVLGSGMKHVITDVPLANALSAK
jgi:mannose-1-phosphate guanylyltransferase/phosphomannomutase